MKLARRINRCDTCHMLRHREQVSTQPSLFLHGGYGEAVTTTVDHCRCESRVVKVAAVNPVR
jgi:hypothetical protein